MSSLTLPFSMARSTWPSRAVWIVASLFVATLFVVFALILDSGDTINQIAVERQRSQLSLAIERDTEARLEQILDLAVRELPEPSHNRAPEAAAGAFASGAIILRALDDVVVVTPDWRYIGGSFLGRKPGKPELAELKASFEGLADSSFEAFKRRMPRDDLDLLRTLRASALSALTALDGQVYLRFAFAVVSLPAATGQARQADRMFVIGRKLLDEKMLNAIASRHGIDRIEIHGGDERPDATALTVMDPAGRVAAHLTWSSERPGDVVRRRLLPLTLAGFALVIGLFALIAGYQHWLARGLARSEANSRLLLGRDPLSGLANRMHFSDQLDLELARLPPEGDGLAVLFIDLDRFKDVNDTYGHQAGDDLIRLVAERLLWTVQRSDLIARFGGDEFAIIQTGLRVPEEAAVLARRILDALTRPFTLAHSQVIVGASIGIALAPLHGTRREILMGLADTALYQSKSEGRNRFSFFQDRMDTTIQMRKTVEEDLRRAIQEDELVLHYQPLFSADGVRIVALEALVRWPHPVRGLISPADFIPIAEERGLVIPLGQWVLRTACRDGMRWPGIRIAVNVSPIEFRHRDFVASVMATLEEAGFEPHRLELELTEGVVVEDADAAESAMMELRAAGVHLALDDFGTGYSSLIYLRRFAFDTIKIDRSFLESMETTGESAILVHSMVHLGRALGLTVTAEGVETSEQHRFLQALGCHQLQGFLFSRPVPAAQIDAMLGTTRMLVSAA